MALQRMLPSRFQARRSSHTSHRSRYHVPASRAITAVPTPAYTCQCQGATRPASPLVLQRWCTCERYPKEVACADRAAFTRQTHRLRLDCAENSLLYQYSGVDLLFTRLALTCFSGLGNFRIHCWARRGSMNASSRNYQIQPPRWSCSTRPRPSSRCRTPELLLKFSPLKRANISYTLRYLQVFTNSHFSRKLNYATGVLASVSTRLIRRHATIYRVRCIYIPAKETLPRPQDRRGRLSRVSKCTFQGRGTQFGYNTNRRAQKSTL